MKHGIEIDCRGWITVYGLQGSMSVWRISEKKFQAYGREIEFKKIIERIWNKTQYPIDSIKYSLKTGKIMKKDKLVKL